MDLLLLGGTAFLGRAIASAAKDRAIAITCLARGTHPAPEGMTLIRADRDEDDALVSVADRSWDAVIDLASQPGHARRAVRDLKAGHWVFVSSANAYTRGDVREQDERAPVHEPLAGDAMEDMSQYGPAKVACENAVRENCESFTIVRAGLIGGAGTSPGKRRGVLRRLLFPFVRCSCLLCHLLSSTPCGTSSPR